MRHRIALATYDRAPALAPDDRLLIPALAACGITAEPAIWSSPSVAWEQFNAVVIRSCWDYHLHIESFRGWLDHLEALGVPVLNTPALVRWNSEKRYLLDLARRGVATIPTIVVAREKGADVEPIAAAEGWRHFVIKPAVSASGYETYALRTPLGDAARAAITRVTSLGDALVQPFAAEVARDGELSLTFIAGEYSHATLKRAAPGEFRVQAEHGGHDVAATPARRLVEHAERVIGALAETPVYARVDGIARDESFLLMELELIEPNLYLANSAGAADKLARAIALRMAR